MTEAEKILQEEFRLDSAITMARAERINYITRAAEQLGVARGMILDFGIPSRPRKLYVSEVMHFESHPNVEDNPEWIGVYCAVRVLKKNGTVDRSRGTTRATYWVKT